ncbi:hypothetical protein VTI28DRAFT_5660 [Corynascus sepedonium]
MRFALAAVALAGAAVATVVEEEAQSTFTSYEYVTITSCGPEHPECTEKPSETTSTLYSTTTRTVSDIVVTETTAYTTVCPITASESAVPSESEAPEAPEESEVPSPSVIPPVESSTLVTVAPECPTTSVKTIKTSITTVIPTIIYETVDVPCETSPAPSNPVPTPSGGLPPTTSSVTSTPPIETAGAASFGAPAALAAAAGLFALFA